MPAYLLHEACQNGERDKAKALIKKKWDVNGFDDKHWTPLHCAANARQLELCKYLLTKGANPSLATSNNATALHYLSRMRDHGMLLSILKLMVEKGADVNHPNTYGNTPLHEASLRGSLKCMEFLLSQRARLDVQNSYGETPLHQAIRGGNFPAVELLIRKGARVDLVGRDGYALEQAKRVLDQETYQKIESLVERVSFGANIANSVVDYQSLPPPVVEMATLAGLSSQSVNQNFDLFGDVVRFLTGTKYLTSPPDFEQVPFQPGNPLAVYEVESSSSGSGGFGQVFKARNTKTKLPVAVKVTANQTTKEFKANMNELRLLRRCQHKNVVFFLEAYNVVESQEVWTIMEFMQGGTLQKFIAATSLKEVQIAYITKNILEGLKLLHSKWVVHRDIKGQNIMLTTQGDVKIVDFGLAMDLRKPDGKRAGSPCYMAPEVIRNEPQSFSVDIYALGITLIEMANGEPPNADNKLRALYTSALGQMPLELKNPEKFSDAFKEFVTSCIQFQPERRPTCEQLLQHRWLSKVAQREKMVDIISGVFLKQDLDRMGIGF